MGCNETVAAPRRETATDGAGAAEKAGDVKNKAAPRLYLLKNNILKNNI